MFSKYLLVLAPIVTLAACSDLPSIAMTNSGAQHATTPMVANNLQGIWEGSAYQPNTVSNWTIKTTIAGTQSKIDYPSLNCGGNLTLLNQTTQQMQFRETLTYGKSTCVNNGKTVITQTGANTATFEWFDNSGLKGAYGNLRRRR